MGCSQSVISESIIQDDRSPVKSPQTQQSHDSHQQSKDQFQNMKQTSEHSTKAYIKQPIFEEKLEEEPSKERSHDELDIRDFYTIDDQPVLGTGFSGAVGICIHKATGAKYALKTLHKIKLMPEKLQQLKDEIAIMQDLDHPNILRLHEYFETKDVIYLITQICSGGELLDRLHAQEHCHYSEKVACRYMHTMVSAVACCHSHNIAHRDLKLENFLFESKHSDAQLKLIGE
jgi:hypothetical protein